MAEGTVDAHLNIVLRLFVNRSTLLVSMRKDHELDRYLLEKKKREFSAKERKRGSTDDPICRQFGDFGAGKSLPVPQDKSMPPLQAQRR